MIWLEIALVTLFVLGIGILLWWSWRNRLLAEEQARANAEFAALGRGTLALVHDLRQTVQRLVTDIERARGLAPGELPQVLDSAGVAAQGVKQILESVRGDAALEPPDGSVEGVVRLASLLFAGAGVPIEVRVVAPLAFRGTVASALPVVQNLLSNAVREAGKVEGGRVLVEVDAESLRITNPVRDPRLLDDRIYDNGVSHCGSDGIGLGVARDAAARLGWVLGHEVHGDSVTFFAETRAPAPPRVT